MQFLERNLRQPLSASLSSPWIILGIQCIENSMNFTQNNPMHSEEFLKNIISFQGNVKGPRETDCSKTLLSYILGKTYDIPTQESLACFEKEYPGKDLKKKLEESLARTEDAEVKTRINQVIKIVEKLKSTKNQGGRTSKRHRRASRKSSSRRVRRTRRRVWDSRSGPWVGFRPRCRGRGFPFWWYPEWI